MQGFPVTFRFPVQWGDMDAFNHVNNVRHFSWFESARTLYFRKVGLMSSEPTGIGPILRATNAEYLRPVSFPADLIVGARVSRIGKTSFTMEYACAEAATPDTHVSRGGAVIVVLRYPEYEKLDVPDSLRNAIEALEGRTL